MLRDSGIIQRDLQAEVQARINPVMSVVDITKTLSVADPSNFNRKIRTATNQIEVKGQQGLSAYQLTAAPNTNQIPYLGPNNVLRLEQTCEAIKTADCNAFKNPEFAANCMITHAPGTDSQGKAHIGGILLGEADRLSQMRMPINRNAMYPDFESTSLGATAAPGKNSATYEQCIAMDEKLRCEQEQNFSIPNCAICQNGQGTWSRIPPTSVKLAPKLVLVGSGTATVAGTTVQLSAAPTAVGLPADSEGNTYSIIVRGTQPSIAGYLSANMSTGPFTNDISLLTKDLSADVRADDFITVDGNQLIVLRATKETTMTVNVFIPFSFYNFESCPGSPFSTKESSVKFLQSDPCYNPNKPGQHSLACLQGKFTQAGCTTSGEGYPSGEEAATKLRYVNGQAQNLAQIANRIGTMSKEAATGRRDGRQLSVSEWDTISRACTGKRITGPCSGFSADAGPLSDDCIQYLFENRGSAKDEGSTYTGGPQVQSASPAGQFCTKEGLKAPYTAANLEEARAKGGIDGVKKYFDDMQRMALNNSLSDTERKQAVLNCYGINFAAPRDIGAASNPLAVPKQNISIQPANTNNYLRHSDFKIMHQPSNGSDLFKNDASFALRPPLCGKPGYVSMEAVNYPDYYFINGPGARAKIEKREQSTEFNDRACWKMATNSINIMDPKDTDVNRGCGLPGFASFESKYTAGAFLRAAPKGIVDLFIPRSDEDRKAACFKPVPGLIQKK